jgi:uncharacterized membrane protein YheB (UPF0754 family)
MTSMSQVESSSSSTVSSLKSIRYRFKAITNTLSHNWKMSIVDIKVNPLKYLAIPIVAAIVGYITNWLGVSMLFYPIRWTGIPILKIDNQPLGVLGWQGIVPAKRLVMSTKMYDITISKLLKISEIFERLDPTALTLILSDILKKSQIGEVTPLPILKHFTNKIAVDVIKNIEKLVDLKKIVIHGLTNNPSILGTFFQKVAAKELSFLIVSGTYFGFILGLFQMLQWMLFPYNWTLPIGGAVVGYITNWIALKWIFEPLVPTHFGPFLLHGMFLRRQTEVSTEFCTYLCRNILNSYEIWKSILLTRNVNEFMKIISIQIPFLTLSMKQNIIEVLQKNLLLSAPLITSSSTATMQKIIINKHPLHLYINNKLNLEKTLIYKMNKLSPVEFEQILHPIFQEDELTLIIAGGVLGMLAGFLQWFINISIEKYQKNKENKKRFNFNQVDHAAMILLENNNTLITSNNSNSTGFTHEILNNSMNK